MTPLLAGYGIAIALIGAWSTYATVKRQRSGSIRTSEADRLWAESDAMRHELRDQLAAEKQARKEEVAAMDAKCQSEVSVLTAKCEAMEASLRAEIVKLQARLEAAT